MLRWATVPEQNEPKTGSLLCPFPWGGAGSPSNTMWSGPMPTCMPSFILIHPAVWPQYTNVTDRQDRQTDNGLIAYRVAQKIWHNYILYALTVPNIYRFSKLFHYQNQEKICNNTVTKDPTKPRVSLHYLVKCQVS